MRHEPPIDRDALAEAVRGAYGLAPASLTFVPVGYAAACYDLRDEGGRRRFLKLWPATGAGRAAAARLDATLPLLVALAGQGIRVPAPLPTRQGGLAASFAGQPFALFPFVVGRAPPPWSAWPPALQAELGRTLAAIHLATPRLARLLPARDPLETTFEAELRRGLAALERLEGGARPGQRALRESVLPRAGEMLAQLDRLAALRALVRREGAPLVLCHTDIGADNLRLDRAGRLTVLDWDEATIAPPEHDLQDLRGPVLAGILVAYLAAGGVRALSLDRFAFALLGRHLGDATARLTRILDEPLSPAEDADALAGIEAWGFAQWRALERTLDGVAAALSRAGVESAG
ncbi:MAG TPA: phosphotransferase [Chloroflexota bacterium]